MISRFTHMMKSHLTACIRWWCYRPYGSTVSDLTWWKPLSEPLLISLKSLITTLGLFVLVLANAWDVRADNYDLYGGLLLLSQTGRIADRFDYNLFASSTYNFSPTTFQGKSVPSRDTQLYLQPSVIFKQSANLNFALGYAFQKNNPLSEDFSDENRIWQQSVVSNQLGVGRMTHRFRFEERFIHDRKTGGDPLSTRARYQLGYSMPLQGREIDAGEFYLNSFNEIYLSLSGQRNATYSENWTYAGVGYLIAGVGKLELGPLYQTAVINNSGDRRNFLVLQLGLSTTF